MESNECDDPADQVWLAECRLPLAAQRVRGSHQDVDVTDQSHQGDQHPCVVAGTQIAFEADGDLWTVDPNGDNLDRVTATPTMETYPAWSSDSPRGLKTRVSPWGKRCCPLVVPPICPLSLRKLDVTCWDGPGRRGS